MATFIAILEPAYHYGVEGGSRNNTKMSEIRDRVCEGPVGDGHAHAALDDPGKSF